MTCRKLWHSAQHTKSPQQMCFFLRQPHLTHIPGTATTIKSICTTQGKESMCRHGSRTLDVCMPGAPLVTSGVQRAGSSRGRTTLRVSTTQAPSGKSRACRRHSHHLACRGLDVHLLGIHELCACKVCAAFPVVLISSVAPRCPLAGLRAPQGSVSMPSPALTSPLWHRR